MRVRPALALTPRRSVARRLLSRARPEGFTLVELVIVVAIVGILVAIAIPSYQQARSAALVGSVIGDLISYAKACAVINASGVGEKPAPPPLSPTRGGVVIQAGCSAANEGARLEASWGNTGADGVSCYSSRSRLSNRKAVIEITNGASDTSIMTCTFADS